MPMSNHSGYNKRSCNLSACCIVAVELKVNIDIFSACSDCLPHYSDRHQGKHLTREVILVATLDKRHEQTRRLEKST